MPHANMTVPLDSPLALGYSFCPNDTFIFHAWQAGLVTLPPPFAQLDLQVQLQDVQTLNEWASQGHLAITKISYRAFFEVLPHYIALPAGGALGRGVGPLLVGSAAALPRLADTAAPLTIASPGNLTTAELLLTLCWQGRPWQALPMRYDEIMPAVQRGEYNGQPIDGGLIIHESRFTYAQQGLALALDLGEWWEQQTQLPLPLGAILVRRNLPLDLQKAINQTIQRSLAQAWDKPQLARDYIRQHALEMSDEVMQSHIDLYVNELSHDLGQQGRQAVAELQRRAVASGVLEDSPLALFVETK